MLTFFHAHGTSINLFKCKLMINKQEYNLFLNKQKQQQEIEAYWSIAPYMCWTRKSH